MRIAIIGGNPEDERHVARLAEKSGHVATFIRPSGAPAEGRVENDSADSSPLAFIIDRLEVDRADDAAPESQIGASTGPRALVFEAFERVDVALRVLASVRRDPYFERVGTLLLLNAEQARNVSLPGGFDDFVLCPCGVEELSIRVRALGRRRARPGAPILSNSSGVLVDETSRTVFVDGHAVQLTAREFALFTYLCEWRGRVLSREHLLARVWGSRYSGGRRTVDIHVRRLRAKLGASLSIETLRGSGYRLQRHPSSDVLNESITEDDFVQMPEPFSKVS